MIAAVSSSTPAVKADAVIIGGGIYGLMTALEAGKAGRRTIVLERGAVGGATSANWFRILHGGLRYLQALDVTRFRESVLERRWFARFAPDLVRPQRFLMPLYGQGARRPIAFRAAFVLDAALGLGRNAGLEPNRTFPRGRVLGVAATRALFPGARVAGLQGGALWYDAVAHDGAQLVARVRAKAEALGATVLENTEALDLCVEGGAVAAVTARRDGATQVWRAPIVVNAAGPWSAEVAARLDCPEPALFRPSLGFNMLLDIAPPAEVGVAVSPAGQATPTLFIYPKDGRAFVGTWHAPWHASWHASWQHDGGTLTPPDSEIDAFLAALNAAVPSLGVRRKHIAQIFAGLLPAQSEGTVDLSDRAIIRDHGARGGPAGLFSVSGVKFTTSRRVAETLVRQWPPLSRAPTPEDQSKCRSSG